MNNHPTFSPTIFRAYDIRGIVGETISEQDYFEIARLLAAWAVEKNLKDAVIGYDGRLSSPGLANALINGLRESGMDCYAVRAGADSCFVSRATSDKGWLGIDGYGVA